MKNRIFFLLFCLVFLICLLPLSAAAQLPVKGIVLLVDFSDSPAVLTPDHVNNLMNVEGYTEPNVTSSIRDYWMQQSRDSVELTHEILVITSPRKRQLGMPSKNGPLFGNW